MCWKLFLKNHYSGDDTSLKYHIPCREFYWCYLLHLCIFILCINFYFPCLKYYISLGYFGHGCELWSVVTVQSKPPKHIKQHSKLAMTKADKQLEKVALDGSVETVRLCRDGVTLKFDLLTQKRNQVISVPRCNSDKSLAKIRQQILEISRKHETTTWITDGRTDARTDGRPENI